MKWQQSSEGRREEEGGWGGVTEWGRENGKKNRGYRPAGKSSLLNTTVLPTVPVSGKHRHTIYVPGELQWAWGCSLQGSQRPAPLSLQPLDRLCESRDGLTHPIQTAKVLHHVLVCVWVIVDHSVLFVHTSRLQSKDTVRKISKVISTVWFWFSSSLLIRFFESGCKLFKKFSKYFVLIYRCPCAHARPDIDREGGLTSKDAFISQLQTEWVIQTDTLTLLSAH